MAVQKRLNKAGKKIYIARWRDPAGKERSKSFHVSGLRKRICRMWSVQSGAVSTSRILV